MEERFQESLGNNVILDLYLSLNLKFFTIFFQICSQIKSAKGEISEVTDYFSKFSVIVWFFSICQKSELSWNFQARCKSRGGGGGERGEEGGGGAEKPRRRKKKWAGGEFLIILEKNIFWQYLGQI